jgi:uncharacterized protein YdaU (DUF1376 family)
MFKYLHHIGDFNRATRHLSRLERSIYLDLIHLYYDTELPLSADKNSIYRRILAKGKSERLAVDNILNEFFVVQADGRFFHSRCDIEIYEYKKTLELKSEAGKRSAALKAERKANALNCKEIDSTGVEHVLNCVATDAQHNSTNHKPLTVNLKPTEKTPDGWEEFWRAYPRKEKKHDALKAFKKIKPSSELLTQLLAKLKTNSHSDQWQKDKGKYVPMAATWLNGKRWEDEAGISAESNCWDGYADGGMY